MSRYKYDPFNGLKSFPSLKPLDDLIEEYWNILEHPNFPFMSLNSTTNGSRNFPPYDIIEQSTGQVKLQIALAGYSKDRLSVELEGNILIIRGSNKLEPHCTSFSQYQSTQITMPVYRHQGISQAPFRLTFDMNIYTIIETVEFKDGILSILVTTKKPEDSKKTTFTIT